MYLKAKILRNYVFLIFVSSPLFASKTMFKNCGRSVIRGDLWMTQRSLGVLFVRNKVEDVLRETTYVMRFCGGRSVIMMF